MSNIQLPKGIVPLCDGIVTIAGAFRSKSALVAEIVCVSNERIALVIKRPSDDGRELIRLAVTPEISKLLASHLDRAGWHLDPEGIGCACAMCVAADAIPTTS